MKIKLICPTFYDPNGDLFRPRKAFLPPLSILHLAGMVPGHHPVSILDDAVQELSFDEPADVVGITTTSINIRRAYEIADEYRRRGVTVVLGGIHASTLPDEAAEHADAVVVGEAEDSWPELLADLEQGTLRPRYSRTARESLAGLSSPRYDLLDATRYVRLPGCATPILPVQTARGCPHNCDFCSVTRFWGRKIRLRPVPEVVEEVKRSGARVVFFTDDNFFANPKRAEELCEALAPLGIRFMCQIDSTARKREALVRAAAKAGCLLAFVGFESLNPKSLAALNKGFNNPEEYAGLMRLLHANGVGIYASIMLGLEHDDLETVDETVDFLVRNQAEIAAFFRLTPFPGTPLYDRLREKGQLASERWWLTLGTGAKSLVRYEGAVLTSDDLVKRANKRFYSLGSIARRYRRLRRWKLTPLILNLSSRRKMARSKGSCSF